ncbi:MAG: dihydroorotase [Pseudomonadota bacterium]
MSERIVLPRPDDFHLHLRDGAMLEATAPESARHFARALIMPNLVPPVVTAAEARAYRARIEAAVGGVAFTPLMTLYLTETTDPEDVATAAAAGEITAVKLYPAGATTNSNAGVRTLDRAMPVLERMAEIGLPLCIHGEVTDPEVDIFDREARFLERVLTPLHARLPSLRIVLEHITTSDGIDFVRGAGRGVAGTLTVHHLMLNRTDMLAGGIRPHYYCLPILKREHHREALVAAAVSGDPQFFLGTDSAPHARHLKEAACGCAGCFTAPVALACVAEVFAAEGALPRLPDFVARFGAEFYGLPVNTGHIVLEPGPTEIPPPLAAGPDLVQVFDPGRPLGWRVASLESGQGGADG